MRVERVTFKVTLKSEYDHTTSVGLTHVPVRLLDRDVLVPVREQLAVGRRDVDPSGSAWLNCCRYDILMTIVLIFLFVLSHDALSMSMDVTRFPFTVFSEMSFFQHLQISNSHRQTLAAAPKSETDTEDQAFWRRMARKDIPHHFHVRNVRAVSSSMAIAVGPTVTLRVPGMTLTEFS
ncbi:hypothetical protein PISMIDRAFT_20660 [Pisolithus microcarpus 441]|uniref:Uncharacterized protein n=1 Tax=Pisolithus microcarpus 441 TaxID=765257 RepID=A0A0C9ZZE0_9AGAM|nr:hypothetical protein PISMIDRAFT_20660 [Pisolithus microcarpus 441]